MSPGSAICGRRFVLVLTLVGGVVWANPGRAQEGSPAGPVPPERLTARRAALLERIGRGVVVIRSADERNMEEHPQDSDFRQDDDFFYLTGLETPSSWLVLVARESGPDSAILYLPPRDPEMERWTGRKVGPGSEASRLTGIADVRSTERAEELRGWLTSPASPARGGRFYFAAPEGPCRGRFCTPEAFRALAGADIEVADPRPFLAMLRVVKDEDELRRLRRAIEITTAAQREAMRAVGPGMWEYELEALIEYTFRRQGAERVGFPSIVGSGPNATILHYVQSRRQMKEGELVVADIGAEYGYYTADVTRTFPVSGRFTPRQRALYGLVLGAQEAAIRAVRPGVTIAHLDRIAREYMRANSGDLCRPVTCDRFFVHGLSHWLGLDVHDVGALSTPLAPGMVLTIEPGIYIPEEGIGIRIEDDVLVTATGHEVLSRAAPREPEEIERLMAERRAARGQ